MKLIKVISTICDLQEETYKVPISKVNIDKHKDDICYVYAWEGCMVSYF